MRVYVLWMAFFPPNRPSIFDSRKLSIVFEIFDFVSSVDWFENHFRQFENKIDKFFHHCKGIGEHRSKMCPLINKLSKVAWLEPIHDLICDKKENEQGQEGLEVVVKLIPHTSLIEILLLIRHLNLNGAVWFWLALPALLGCFLVVVVGLLFLNP